MSSVTIETFFSVSRLSPLTCTLSDAHDALGVYLSQTQDEGNLLTSADAYVTLERICELFHFALIYLSKYLFLPIRNLTLLT